MQFMNSTTARPGKRARAWLLAMGVVLGLGVSAVGQNVQHLSEAFAGGMPGLPVITSVEPTTNGYSITWDGPPGYYRLWERSTAPGSKLLALGKATNLVRHATVVTRATNIEFSVTGPSPVYAGSSVCVACHKTVHDPEIDTPHARAFESLKRIGQQTNGSCLPCHTVGYGLPTGFKSEAATPQLGGVQCENCHGPAWHAADDMDPTVRPRVELAATVCGGCHNATNGGPLRPVFEEWSSSAHSGLVEDMNPAGVIDSCGRCHSGSVRHSFFPGLPLPAGDADIPIVCATCHDPHQTNANPFQLRFPLASTNDYFITTSDPFTNQVNPQVNLCAQCHNHRGASWTATGRSPHHSPQYNMLLGTVGELDSPAPLYQPSTHALRVTNQCAGCHMQSRASSTNGQPALAGHKFIVEIYDVCATCHTEPQMLVQFTTAAVSNRCDQIKASLDLWATTKAPEALRSKYGALAWEYTVPGTFATGGSGPASAEQALIPDNIRKARFNLYLVVYDGSYGVHNSYFASSLLDKATQWIQIELNK